jgi:hypothetical protein
VGFPPGHCFGLGSQSFNTAGAFLEGLAEAALVAAEGLGAGFLGSTIFLVAVTIGCSGAYVTG